MSDLISKKAVMEELLAIQDATYMSTCLTVDECKGKRWMIARAIDAVKDAPTIDAVEVVRCKDCEHQHKVWNEDKRYKFGGFWCVSCDRNEDIFVSHTVDGDDNDFCSYGERKEAAE